MKKKYQSELYAKISVDTLENENDDFEVVSIRTPKETHSMVQAITTSFQTPAATLFTEKISQLLAEKLIESKANKKLIEDELENGISPGSALDILRNEKIITIDNPFLLKGLKAFKAPNIES